MICRLFIIVSLIAVIPADDINQNNMPSYEDIRKAAIQAEDLESVGGLLCLNDKEEKVNEIFLKYKKEELDTGYLYPENNTASLNFILAKPLIDNNKIFQFLQKMPKGAALHMHLLGSLSSEGFVKAITYIPGLLRCNQRIEQLNVLSFRQHTDKHSCYTGYGTISSDREKNNLGKEKNYDRLFERIISLDTPTIDVKNASAKRVWSVIDNVLTTMSDAILYLPAYRAYMQKLLEELYNDNIMYAEVRCRFDELYDTKTKAYPANRSVIELIDVVESFKLQHSDFLGFKIIYAANRSAEIDVMRKEIEFYLELKSSFPNYIIGLDLVGREDNGKTIYDFLDVFKDIPNNTKYFFHAGETNFYGASRNLNLLDAILLNTTRIGNGFALTKHPVLTETVIKRDIAVEVCPISNQMFRLVSDLRNHPGTVLISRNVPMVIGNDYPGFWNAKGLSYDFYYAIMSLAPNNAGLKTLKELVRNSIKYSLLESEEKKEAYKQLQTKWDKFIDNVLKDEEGVSA